MKATRINAKQIQGLINNEEERFNDQPAIINIRFYRIFFTKTNLWSALCKHENKYNRVFEGVDIYELANNLRETFDF